MKLNGCDKFILDDATSKKLEADKLIRMIKLAFKGVQLEDGTGLLEADGLDDRKSKQELAELRAQDIKTDWESISDDYINKGWCSLSYFDAKGMRFYLPAYMISDIRKKYNHHLDFCMCHEIDHSNHQFSLFTNEQRMAVREYLNYVFNNEDYSQPNEMVADALLGYWNESNDTA
ncbi:hypothetical protein KO489_12565 [Reinekea forsetii]|nr:hypothetical protein [Reinekea forsetii]